MQRCLTLAPPGRRWQHTVVWVFDEQGPGVLPHKQAPVPAHGDYGAVGVIGRNLHRHTNAPHVDQQPNNTRDIDSHNHIRDRNNGRIRTATYRQ
jgi:hypothetical protein